jgi:hypothetical protein
VVVEEAPGGARSHIAFFREEHELAAMLGDDPGGKQIVVLQLLECRRQFGVPPERSQCRQSESP